MISEKDIFVSSCGEDEFGYTNSIVKVENSILEEDKEPVCIDSLLLDNPIVNMFRSRAFTMIDLTFKDPNDIELIQLSEILKSFCKPENSLDTEFSRISAICITVCPKAYGGEYYLVGIHAMYSIQPSRIGGPIDTIRFIVSNEFFHTYRYDASLVDTETLAREEAEEMVTSNAI